jgi:hypothetical protein
MRRQPPVNVSERKCGEPVWDPRLKRRLLELEEPAIRRFYGSQPDSVSCVRRDRTLADPFKSALRRIGKAVFTPTSRVA